MTSDSAYLNGAFRTGGLAHDLTLGTAGYKAQTYSVITAASAASVRLGTASIAAPVIFARPAAGPPNVKLNYNSSNVYQQGVNLNDSIRMTQAWSVRLGASKDWFHVDNFNALGVTQAGYRSDGISASGSLVFKPADNMTTYATYASSLQAGDLAPGTAANAGVSLEPYRSRQIEVGYKIGLENLDVTAAVFRIERPFANIDPLDRVFRLSGEQVNKGVELSAVGEVGAGLRLFGGLTWLDARMRDTPLASTDGKRYVGAPRWKGNVLLEYALPAVSGLTASVDYQFATSRAGNDTHTLEVAGYGLLDLGARYRHELGGRPVTWRLTVNNVFDRAYWSTVAPSNITGTNAGNMVAHLGSPRTMVGSFAIDF
jgi:iron complex outermembrane receptor protein